MEKFEKIFRNYCTNAYEGIVYFKKFGGIYDAQYGIDLDKKFPVGGITKLFTIACVLKLIENKKLILDSKLPIYLSEEQCWCRRRREFHPYACQCQEDVHCFRNEYRCDHG